VKVTPASLEANVRGVVSKVTLGEADAGIVYVTDVRTAGDKVEGVTIPDAQNVLATYPIATVKATHNAALANAFVAYVRSPDGQQVLARAGFAT
jgi:molybdate transport system substrate-binding protein